MGERHIGLELTDGARQHLADAGYDLVYGARPLKRVIQREVQAPWRWPSCGASLARGTRCKWKHAMGRLCSKRCNERNSETRIHIKQGCASPILVEGSNS